MDVIVLLQLKDVVFNLQVIKVGFEAKSCCFNIEDNLALSMLTLDLHIEVTNCLLYIKTSLCKVR